mgnify:CR=1 FL=1|tara:strand:- start:3736 stop:3966 length:231 start_codon:yes stop_codon:yes gene_type:complete
MTSVTQFPPIGSIWRNDCYTIEVINHDDPRNIDSEGNYIKSKIKKIVYVYLTQPVGKIGGCYGVDGFESCWARRVN